MQVTPGGRVPILKLVGVLLKLKTVGCTRHHFLQFIRQHLVQVFFEEPNGEMLAEYFFDNFRGNLALALLLLKVHLKVLEACCDDLVWFIVVYKICYVLKDRLQKRRIYGLIGQLALLEISFTLLCRIKLQIVAAWEKSVETVVMLQEWLEDVSFLIKEEETEAPWEKLLWFLI